MTRKLGHLIEALTGNLGVNHVQDLQTIVTARAILIIGGFEKEGESKPNGNCSNEFCAWGYNGSCYNTGCDASGNGTINDSCTNSGCTG